MHMEMSKEYIEHEQEELCEDLMDRMYEEFDDIETYACLMKDYREINDAQMASKMQSIGRDEMKHFLELHNSIISSMTESERKERNCFSKLHDRMVEKYKNLKAELEGVVR